MTIETLGDLVFHLRSTSRSRGADLVSVRFPGGARNALSASDFLRAVHSLAIALERRGLAAEDRVAIYAENRPEWHVVDFACQLLGVATVPVFPGLTGDQVAYVLRNSGCRWIFYSDAAKRDVIAGLRGALTSMPTAVAFDGDATLDDAPSLTRLQGEGATQLGEIPLERFRGRAEPDDVASLIYTSGTTGDPKGVMLSHRNFLSNVRGCAEVFDIGPDDLAISFLPLSHVFQRTIDLLCFYRGVPIHYVPFVADVPAALRAEQPTVMAAAPAVYERAWKRTLDRVEAAGAWRRKLFDWALYVGRRHATASREGFVGPLLALQRWLAERWIFADVQRRFGGRIRFAVSGGAPLADDVSAFFEAVGIPLYQGYGLTETSPVLATNHPRSQRPGSVGKTLSDVELRIAEDGEILVRGPGVMKGYWQDPAATAASIDQSGWFRTGDVGRVDRSGYLFVTDRKRDLIVTAEGHNIAPRPVEVSLAAEDGIERAVVVGDGRPFAAALLVPDRDRLRQLLPDADEAGGAGEVAEADEADEESQSDWLDHPEIRAHIDAAVARVNLRLAVPSQLGAWAFLDRPLSAEGGELTPTLKVKRKVVLQRFARVVDDLYRRAEREGRLPVQTGASSRAT